jgi:hypothetical protein
MGKGADHVSAFVSAPGQVSQAPPLSSLSTSAARRSAQRQRNGRLSTLDPGAGCVPKRSRPQEPRGPGDDGAHRGGVVMASLVISVVSARLVGNRIRTRHATPWSRDTPTRCPSSSTGGANRTPDLRITRESSG